MQTYKYQLPVNGKPFYYDLDKLLEHRLKNGEDCLGSYCMFPSKSEILDHVSFETNTLGYMTAINLHTYTELYKGREEDLKECIQASLYDVDADIIGPVKALGLKGKMPEKLYHIVEHEYVDIITKEGIDPQDGGYGYMNDNTHVYMTDKENLATWLAVLKHNDHPVIMEVNTEGLDIKPGGVFKDRGYAPKGYGQYVTTDYIPASAIKETEFTSRFCAELRADMIELSNRLGTDQKEWQEIQTGMQRLKDMGVIRNASVQDIGDVAIERGLIPEVGEEDDFTKAINEMDSSKDVDAAL